MSKEIISFYSDRIIAFHQGYVELTGSVTAALLLGQACYWSKVNHKQEGWFYKTQTEWSKELGLSRKQQETARTVLQKLPFWQEKKEGLPAKLYFRVDLLGLSHFIQNHEKTANESNEKPEPDSNLESGMLVCPKVTSLDARNGHASMPESDILIIRNTKITNKDYHKEVNTVLDIKSTHEEQTTHTTNKKKMFKSHRVWNEGRKVLYRALFQFQAACGDSLGLGQPVLYESMPEEIPWALPEVIEDKFATLLRDYMKNFKISISEIFDLLERLGKYIRLKKPFVFQKKSVLSLEALCDHPKWFSEWMTEALTEGNLEDKKSKDSIPMWKKDWDQYSDNQKEEHYSFGKKAIDDLKLKLIH